MAYYAALVSLVELLKEISHHDRYPNSFLKKKQIATLYKKFNLLQELLEDYSPKDEKAADILERRMRDAAYQAQDIIESHIYIEKKTHGVKRFFRHLVLAFRKAPRQLQDLKKVQFEVDSIVEELKRIKVESHTTHQDNLQLNSYISAEASKLEALSGRSTMVGFEEHLTTIKGQLCGQSSRREVISIFGMGGIGKTTLAKNIFDDKLIDYHFDCRAWVTVSQDYHMLNILLAIVSSLNNNQELHGVGEEVLEEDIYKHLKGKRYLLIMDDLWETKVWDNIKRILPDDSNGSRVMITTRLSDVANYAGRSAFVHQMQFLNEDQSWKLLREKVFAQEHCPKELEVIGKLIANNCRGLPLAIVVIAGVLSNVNKARHDWEEIARNVSSAAIDQNDEHFSKILSLSYNHLPHHLKPCFLYLGGFPKDYEIPISKLIKLWVAEGFLKPNESKSLEELGEKYLEDLVKRSLVLVTKMRSNGKFKCCSIHDLLRDLCSQRARYENFLHCLHKKDDFHREPMGNVRRLCIHPDHSLSKLKKEHISHVRAVLFYQSQSRDFLIGFDLLRVLGIVNEFMLEFPNAIVELLHLRYLAIRGHNFRIPVSIFKLQNLQTLIIDGKTGLPSEIWKMSQLRHVMIWEVTVPPVTYGESIIGGVPLLGRLQTLWRVKDFRFTPDTIEMIPSLKKMKVHCTKKPYRNWHKFGLDNLVHLRQLESLDIRFSKLTMVAVPLPENFAFPVKLKKLTLEGCELPWKEMTAVGSLPNLQVLKLRRGSFVGEEWEPIGGQFPKLKFLQMEDLPHLKYWRAESNHFPCLEQLHIRYCWELEEIPAGIGEIPTLELIEVHYNNSAVDSSASKVQEEQRDLGNDALQVHTGHHFIDRNFRSYDNWERLVEAVIRREQLRQLFLDVSRSPSISSFDSDLE